MTRYSGRCGPAPSGRTSAASVRPSIAFLTTPPTHPGCCAPGPPCPWKRNTRVWDGRTILLPTKASQTGQLCRIAYLRWAIRKERLSYKTLVSSCAIENASRVNIFLLKCRRASPGHVICLKRRASVISVWASHLRCNSATGRGGSSGLRSRLQRAPEAVIKHWNHYQRQHRRDQDAEDQGDCEPIEDRIVQDKERAHHCS